MGSFKHSTCTLRLFTQFFTFPRQFQWHILLGATLWLPVDKFYKIKWWSRLCSAIPGNWPWKYLIKRPSAARSNFRLLRSRTQNLQSNTTRSKGNWSVRRQTKTSCTIRRRRTYLTNSMIWTRWLSGTNWPFSSLSLSLKKPKRLFRQFYLFETTLHWKHRSKKGPKLRNIYQWNFINIRWIFTNNYKLIITHHNWHKWEILFLRS